MVHTTLFRINEQLDLILDLCTGKKRTATVIDSKTTGYNGVTQVNNKKGEWILYSEENYQGTE